jgi:hypothetical protein
VPERVIVFCTMAYQNFVVTEPLTQTTPFLRYCSHPELQEKAMPFQEDCSRLGAPNELTGAAQLGKFVFHVILSENHLSCKDLRLLISLDFMHSVS